MSILKAVFFLLSFFMPRLFAGFSRTNISALLLSFIFLLIILIINGIYQWRQQQAEFLADVDQTINNFAHQSQLLAQASYRTNVLFVRGNKALIERAVQEHSQSQQQLWNELQYSIFNLTGAAVFSAQGEQLLSFGETFNNYETEDIWQNILDFDEPQQAFALRYGDKGGFYIYTSFYNSQNELWYLVVRRSYSDLSQIIYNGDFAGYELLFLDARKNSVIIREQYFANTRHQLPLSEAEQQAIIQRVSFPHTHWDLAALLKPAPFLALLWKLLWQPLLVLSTFSILAGLFAWRAQTNRLQAQRLKQAEHEAQQRASQLLNVIKDAYITTDNLGRITYANPKATSLLAPLTPDNFMGQSLSELWPDPQALWNQAQPQFDDGNTLEPQALKLSLLTESNLHVFEQSSMPMFEGPSIIGHVWLLRDISLATLAQQEAQESNERYKALFDEASVGHCLFDVSLFKSQDRIQLLRLNDAAMRMAQADSHQHFQNDFLMLTGKADNPFNYYLKRALALNLPTTEFELPITTFKGESKTLWATISISAHNNKHVLASFIDISEQKISIQQTREREVFWNKVMDAMPDLVYVVDLGNNDDINIIYSNRTLGSILGYQKASEDSNDWSDYWVNHLEENDRYLLARAISKIKSLAMGQTHEIAARFRHADGSVRIIKFRDTPMTMNAQGQVARYIGTVRDVTEDIEQQEQILDSERRYRLLAENINDVIWATDAQLNFNFVSSSAKHILGYQPDELLRAGVEEVFRKRDIKIFSHQIVELINHSRQLPANTEHKSSLVKDMVAYHKNGHEVLLEVQASPLYNDAGQPQGVVGICRDVGEARRLQSELHLAAEVFDKSNEGIIITNRHKRIVKLNSAVQAITGFNEQDLLHRRPTFLVPKGSENKELLQTINTVLDEQGYWQGEVSYLKANGDVRTAWAGVSAVQESTHGHQSLIIILSDITERKRAEERIRQLAYYDTLTGLANRSQLNERLSFMMEKASSYNQAVALLFIDLDRFKPINDSMGHPAGDAVLQEVANRLRSCVKKNDFICRMGGDEFTLAIDAQPKREVASNARNVAERILQVLNEPYILGKHEVFLSGSIGVAIYPDDATSVIELIKRADMAMYRAKELGRNNVQFFDHSMNQQALEQLVLENDLRHALERQQLELYYQPQYCTVTQQPIAVEALLRWHHPERGLVPPSVFIPIIEDTGLIEPIGRWVLNQACQQLAQWQQQQLNLQRVAVNVSARQFKQADFASMVLQAIEDSGIHTYELELEITESILIDDVEHTLNTLNKLKKIGVRTAIDDFGTGYSSLNYLKQFPVDTLKIDRSFIQGLPDNDDDSQITHTIIAMAHNLGMGVIAEGVESDEQLEFLVAAQCEEVQGFLLSRPLPVDACFAYLNNAFNQQSEEISTSTWWLLICLLENFRVEYCPFKLPFTTCH